MLGIENNCRPRLHCKTFTKLVGMILAVLFTFSRSICTTLSTRFKPAFIACCFVLCCSMMFLHLQEQQKKKLKKKSWKQMFHQKVQLLLNVLCIVRNFMGFHNQAKINIRPQQFKRWIALSHRLISPLDRISFANTNVLIHWIGIYPVESASQLLNNCCHIIETVIC